MRLLAKDEDFVRKRVSGLQEMMVQKQSEHKMSPYDDTLV